MDHLLLKLIQYLILLIQKNEVLGTYIVPISILVWSPRICIWMILFLIKIPIVFIDSHYNQSVPEEKGAFLVSFIVRSLFTISMFNFQSCKYTSLVPCKRGAKLIQKWRFTMQSKSTDWFDKEWSTSPPLLSQEIMQIQGCVTHVSGPTFWARSNGIGFESLRRLQGHHGGQHDSRFWARPRGGGGGVRLPPTPHRDRVKLYILVISFYRICKCFS